MKFTRKGLVTITILISLLLSFQATRIIKLESQLRTTEQHAETFKDRLGYFTQDEYMLDPYTKINIEK